MFSSHPLTAAIEAALEQLPFSVRHEVRATFRDYAALLQVAERDRQAVLGFVDNLDSRLDDLPEDPSAAYAVAKNIATRVKRDSEREGRANVAAEARDRAVREGRDV